MSLLRTITTERKRDERERERGKGKDGSKSG